MSVDELLDERILVLAPGGRDAALTVAALTHDGLRAESCLNMEIFCASLEQGAGAAIIAQEALTRPALFRLEQTLSGLAAWSDFPMLILTGSPRAPVESSLVMEALSRGANTTLLERPIRRATLLSAVQTALRSRRRQYEVRDHLLERERQEQELRAAAEREKDLRAKAQADRERLDLVLAGISDAFFMLDSQWRFTYVNRRVLEITRKTQDQLLGRNVWETYSYAVDTPIYEALRRAMTERTAIQVEYPYPGGARWYDCRAYPTDHGLAVFMGDMTDRKRAEEESRERLSRQQHIAETLQRSLLPAPQNYPGLEISTQYEAASSEADVGGDFYDCFRIDERRIALVVGDVVGKGLPAAAHMAEVKFALRAMLRENAHPAIAMERLNNFLVDAQVFDNDSQDQLVAMSLAVYDLSTGDLLVTAASAEPPLVVRAGGEVLEIAVRGVVLGGSAKSSYDATTVQLQSGDTLIMVTDGITEARRGREFFGYEGFQRAAQEAYAAGWSLQAIGRQIIAEAQRFAGGKLRDDACILLTRRV